MFVALFVLRTQKEIPLSDCLKFSLCSQLLPLALSHSIANSHVNNYANLSYRLSSKRLSFLVRFLALHHLFSHAK